MEKSKLYTKSYDLTLAAQRKLAELQKKSKENPVVGWWFKDIASISLQLALSEAYRSRQLLQIKLYIARKGCLRAQFWSELLLETGVISQSYKDEIATELTDIGTMILSVIRELQSRRNTARKVQQKQ